MKVELLTRPVLLNSPPINSDKLTMKKVFFKLSLTKRSTLLALFLAQGAPLGYIFHKFLFVPYDKNLLLHALYLVNHETHAMAYMWLGTSLFFAVFGYAIGKKAEQLRLSNEYLQQALMQKHHLERMKRRFLVGLIDQIRTPISIALEFLGGYKVGFWGISPERIKDLSQIATSELVKLDETLRKMLDLKNLKKLGIENRTLESLNHLLSGVTQDYSHKHSTREIIFKCVPENGAPAIVNRDLIRIAVEHLINNSLQHAPAKKISVLLEARTGQEIGRDPNFSSVGDQFDWKLIYYVISVSDDGAGIAPNIVQSVFEPFVGAYSNDNARPSLGLGLALVRDIAEWHGGVAWIESRENQGTRVLMVIPIGDEASEKQTLPKARAA
jgi:signal transduction histidine kinase